MGPQRRQMQKDADQDVKSELLDNYEDHVYLK